MSKEILADQLAFIKEQAEFIQDTTSEITGVNDFLSSQSGMVLYNSTCMCLQTIGETVKKIDESTKGNFLLIPDDSRPPIPVILGHPC